MKHATYLMNTVKFHLEGLFAFLDEEHFLYQLNQFHHNALETVENDRLWYTEYLLILALGTGLLATNTSSRDALPGIDYFRRAMAVLPETPRLHEEPVIGVELLALISLYFYCSDMRQTAYSYVSKVLSLSVAANISIEIGQAVRLALVEGNHTNLNDSQLGNALAERCTNLW